MSDPTFSRISLDVVRGPFAQKAAAYNLSGKLGAFDFSRKQRDYVAGTVLLPASAPETYRDPSTLWAEAQRAERQQATGQPARQVLASIPRECPPHLYLDLARAIAAPWVADGMAAQLDVHSPRASDGERQPHIHIMLTMRRMTVIGMAKTKERSWNGMFREDQAKKVRGDIADRMNTFFAQHSLDINIDPRSLAARGIQRAPEPIAPAADWQRFLREGARPENRPITVQRVMQHREARRTWERATASADAWSAHATKLEAEMAALRRENTKKVEAAMEGKSAPPPAEHQTPRGEPIREEPKMAKGNKLPGRTDSWRRGSGGWDALTDEQQRAAQAAHQRWIADIEKRGRTVHGARYGLESYVAYVQDAGRREERRQAERKDTPPTARPAEEQQPQPDGIAPASPVAAERSRTTHLERLLAERYQAPAALAAHVRRIDVDSDGRTATLHTQHGRIVDHGDRLTSQGTTSPELAAATVAAAAAKGWTSVRLSGSADYKQRIAVAAALNVPPLTTDHELDDQGRQTVRDQLRARATVAIPALGETTGMAPADAARARIDHEIAAAEALRAGEPQGPRDPKAISAPRIAELAARRDEAIQEAAESDIAARSHREAYGWASRLLDPAVRRSQAALDASASAQLREAKQMDRGHDWGVRRIEKEALKAAKATERAHADWKWSRPVRQAEAQLSQLVAIKSAIEAGDERTIEAAANGKLKTALTAATEHQARAEQERAAQEAAERAAALAARTPAELKRDALAASLAAERVARSDPKRLEAARQTTAAIANGDTAAIGAAGNGDMTGAAKAAKRWQLEQDRLADELREERDRRDALEAAGQRLEFEYD